MSQSAYALIGLTVIVAVLSAVVAFAVMKFIAAARDSGRHLRDDSRPEMALLSAALQEAVAKLKAQERAMSERATASEQLSGQIVESLTAGLLVVNSDGTVQILNAAGRRLLDIIGDGRGLSYQALLARAPPLIAVVSECLQDGRAIVRRSLQMPEGMTATHVGVTVSPLPDGHGVICLFADLTNVVALEEQLRLKDTLARLGELTAGIAHEFRNGLATIHGYSRLIDPNALPPQYKPYVEGIRQETEALGNVVTNFLNFARPEQVAFARVEIGPIATREAEDIRRELAPDATIEIAGEFGAIQGDDVLLRQMFSNLVRNAVEACQGAGTRPVVRLTGTVDAETVHITVADNGPGIPPAARDRVFQPFFTTRAQGTGLGLAIVLKIVVTHSGRIVAGVSPLGGASFELTFPVTDQ